MEFQTNLFQYRKVTIKHFVLPFILFTLLVSYTLSYAEIFTGLRSVRSVGTATNALFTVGTSTSAENLVGFALPTITTNASINNTQTTALLNGSLSVGGDSSCDSRGFVWDTVSRSDPGNVAPSASPYSGNFSQNGAFATGSFSHQISGLINGQQTYFRATFHTETGWAYGSEMSLRDNSTVWNFGSLIGLMAVVFILVFLVKTMEGEITLETIIISGVLIILAIAFVVSIFNGLNGV